MSEPSRHLILDRDGVINEDSDAYIRTPEQWLPIPEAIEAIALFTRAGYTISIATNQSGIARGYYTLNTLEAIHDKMLRVIRKAGGEISQIVFCPHGPSDDCACRKPKAGLLHQLEDRFAVPLLGTPLVGDSFRDLVAAMGVGCRPILVLTGKGRKTESDHDMDGICVFPNLLAVAQALLKP